MKKCRIKGNSAFISSCHPRVFLSGISSLLKRQSGGDSQLQHLGMTPNLMGFTLIELLVVVLIIGILAAVALPQYQKAVVKAKAAKVITLMSTIARAREAKYLETGEYVDSFRALDLDFPENNLCGSGYCYSNFIQGQDWHIALDSLAASFGHLITGQVPNNPYFDTAIFVILQTNPLGLEVQLGKVYCVDAIGEYSSGLCTNVMHGTLETEIDHFGQNMGVYSFN